MNTVKYQVPSNQERRLPPCQDLESTYAPYEYFLISQIFAGSVSTIRADTVSDWSRLKWQRVHFPVESAYLKR